MFFVYLLLLETPIFRIMNLIKTCATWSDLMKVQSDKCTSDDGAECMYGSVCMWTFSG